MASVIGPVPEDGGQFLPFLIRFREIVESDVAVETKLRLIDDFCQSSSERSAITKRIRRSKTTGQIIGSDDFAKKFFARDIERIPGVGSGLALRLFEAGFQTAEEVAKAGDADLMAVKGLGAAAVGKIRSFFAAGSLDGGD